MGPTSSVIGHPAAAWVLRTHIRNNSVRFPCFRLPSDFKSRGLALPRYLDLDLLIQVWDTGKPSNVVPAWRDWAVFEMNQTIWNGTIWCSRTSPRVYQLLILLVWALTLPISYMPLHLDLGFLLEPRDYIWYIWVMWACNQTSTYFFLRYLCQLLGVGSSQFRFN